MAKINDTKYIKLLKKHALTSRCPRAKVAAIIVKNDKILVKATNGYHKIYDYKKIGSLRNRMRVPSGTQREIDLGLCAEQYAIAIAAKKGISLKGSTIYVSSHPCRICESLIVESGIKRVVYLNEYNDILPKFDILKDHGIKSEKWETPKA